MSQIQWTTGLVMAGLFAMAIIMFSAGFANDNTSPINVVSDPSISSLNTQITGNASSFNTGAENTYSSIVKSSIPPTSTSGTLTTTAPFTIGFTNVFSVIKNIMEVTYSKIFGNDARFGIFVYSFLGMILFITGLLIWKTFRGQPD